MTYGEAAIKYKDSLYLENGEYKASEPPPKESQRMPKDKIGEYINAKLEPIWAKFKKPPPAWGFVETLKRRLREHENESEAKISKIKKLLREAKLSQSLLGKNKIIRSIEEVLDE